MHATADVPDVPVLKNKWVNAAAFPLFAATAYYFFDEAGESFDQIKSFVRAAWYKNVKDRPKSWLAEKADALSKKILRRRTRKELLMKELDKQTYYLTGAIGTSIITWLLRTYLPEAGTVLSIGEKS